MRQYLLIFFLLFGLVAFAQEGTKQLMPKIQDSLFLEFKVFAGNNFGLIGCSEKERINIYLKRMKNST